MMAVFGMSLKEIEDLTIPQFLLYSVELVDIMKEQNAAGGQELRNVEGIAKEPFLKKPGV